MNSVFWFIFYITIWRTIHTIECKLEKGLIFNTKLQKLDDISDEDGEKVCPSCMIACPATSEREVQVNEHVSVSKHSVFVWNTYGEEERAVDIKTDVCDKSIKPAIIFDRTTSTYEFGYELYYREYGDNMKCLKYDDFKVITEEGAKILENLSITKIDDLVDIVTKDGYADKTIKVSNGTKFKFPYGRDFVFYWVSVLSFNFNPDQYQIRMYLNADIVNDYNKKKECSNRSFGSNLYVSKFYPFSFEVSGSVVKTALAPMTYFHTDAAKLAGCILLNSIPVWNHVHERLKLIDQYLYALYRRFNPNINMFFGVSGKSIYEDITDDKNNLPADGTAEKNIIMPNIIYRVVEYAMPLSKTTLNFYLVVFIHNERDDISHSKRLCPEDQMSDLNVMWNEKKEEGIVSYACAPDLQLLKDLGVFIRDPVRSLSTLKLSEFRVSFDQVNGGYVIQDVTQIIEKDLNELLKKGKL